MERYSEEFQNHSCWLDNGVTSDIKIKGKWDWSTRVDIFSMKEGISLNKKNIVLFLFFNMYF